MGPSLPAGTQLGRYKILSQIGAGGMGEVYRARDTELDRTVAIKILPESLASDQQRLQRFIQEARTVSALNHPNILTIHEFGQAQSARFIVTEFVEGLTLREYMGDRTIKLPQALDILVQVATALDAAHEARVVHRDIKPENIMIRRRDHIVKVVDFGLAKPLAQLAAIPNNPLGDTNVDVNVDGVDGIDREAGTRLRFQTEPGVVMGTVRYMSPEQSQGSPAVDHRTDIWSVGVIFYEMITGRAPFEGKDVHRQIIAIQEQPSAPLSTYLENIPAGLDDIVRKALEKDPNQRYQTANELLFDLRQLRKRIEAEGEMGQAISPERMAGTILDSAPIAVSTSPGTHVPVETSPAIAASSAEYIVGRIKHHKIALVVLFAVLGLGAFASAVYFRSRNSVVAIDSIAVLPFVNQNRDPETEYLSDGLTESIINSLAQLQNLRVSPRSAVFQYKGKDTDPMKIANSLGVRAVLTGRLLQRGDTLIVSAELLDVRENKQVWGEQYDRKVSDALGVLQAISREISEKLRTKLTSEEQQRLVKRGTNNPESYQSYLKGRYYWNRRTAVNIQKALEQFQQAVDKDPTYALAYVGLADSYALLEQYAGKPAAETLPKAKAAAQRALEIDDSLAEAHTSLAYINMFSWNFEEAEKEFKRGFAQNPNYPTAHSWYGIYLGAMGRPDEAMTETRRAQQLDPLSPIISVQICNLYMLKGDLDTATTECNKVLELDANFPRAHDLLGWSYLKQGRMQEALVELQKAADNSGRASQELGYLGYGYGVMGNRAAALEILKELEERYARHETPAMFPAAVYAGLGDKNQAFAWLEKDFQAHSGALVYITYFPVYDTLRGDPRYADLLHRMGLERPVNSKQ